jgi:hypothetical protein
MLVETWKGGLSKIRPLVGTVQSPSLPINLKGWIAYGLCSRHLARLISAIHSHLCVKLSTNSTPEKPELKGTAGCAGDRFKSSRVQLLPGGEDNSLDPTGELSLQLTGFFRDFAGVRAGDREGGTTRIIQERRSRSGLALPDYVKDVISKPGIEQHLFTKRAKY